MSNQRHVPALDQLESRFYEMLRKKEIKSAFEFYWKDMGNYSTLGRELGESIRGHRILTQMLEALETWEAAGSLNSNDRSMVYNDYALFSTDIGNLNTARNA